MYVYISNIKLRNICFIIFLPCQTFVCLIIFVITNYLHELYNL